MKKEYKEPEKMTKRELKDWINWGENEAAEYKKFFKTLKTELNKRK